MVWRKALSSFFKIQISSCSPLSHKEISELSAWFCGRHHGHRGEWHNFQLHTPSLDTARHSPQPRKLQHNSSWWRQEEGVWASKQQQQWRIGFGVFMEKTSICELHTAKWLQLLWLLYFLNIVDGHCLFWCIPKTLRLIKIQVLMFANEFTLGMLKAATIMVS